jgi:hypothetical protein
MSAEQINVFYDILKIEKIHTKIESIREDANLNNDMKIDALNEYFDSISDDDKREYEHYKRMVAAESMHKNDTQCCQDKYKNKVLLMEFNNQQPSYARMCAMIGMITYLQTRFDQYKVEEDKPAISRFLTELFNGSSSKYMGTIYDLYYKNNKIKHPAYVPQVDKNILGDLMPSIEQVSNFVNYSDANFEQVRAVVSGIMGYKASHEATIHVHGVFDSADDPELTKYRLANSDKINQLADLLPIPFGYSYLYDKYKDFRSNIVLFNPSDPDVELLHSNRIVADMNSHAMFKKRLTNLEGRMSKQDLKAIKEYRGEIEKVRKLPVSEKPPDMENYIADLKAKIDKIYESNTNKEEVITNVIKIGKGKATKKTYAAKVE